MEGHCRSALRMPRVPVGEGVEARRSSGSCSCRVLGLPTTSPSGERVPLPVNDPQVTVSGGDLRLCIASEVSKARGESGQDEMIAVEVFKKAKALFDSFRRSYGLCPQNIMVDDDGVTTDVRRMVVFWRDCGFSFFSPTMVRAQ